MQTDAINFAQQDEQAVHAVRTGDAERYRELVERHERRVYAVAWSRLGDAALAEEVTQEAFIRAYRRLWLLGDGAKFAGWINTIARRIAINFGLRHRRELNKRERWALENPEISTENSTDESDPLHTPEALRQTLAELPDMHRECLVLFYLEGKSGADTAAALGLSESALRVRLHRARAVLRERLEERLADSLRKLGPAKSLVPVVMAGVLASSSAKAATAGGAGAVVAGVLAKLEFTKWLVPFVSFFSFLFFLPMVLVSWLIWRLELQNYRDQMGFRARLFREGSRRGLLWMALMFVSLFFLVPRLTSGWGFQNFYLLLAAFCLVTGTFSARRLIIIRNRYFIAIMAGSAVIGLGCLLVGFGLLPISWVNLFIFGQAMITMHYWGERPARMDYSLFLRAAAGMLDVPDTEEAPVRNVPPASNAELLAFARFLGARWIVINHRWIEGGLALRLAPVKWWLWYSMQDFGIWTRSSLIVLRKDGTISAMLGEKDQRALEALRPDSLPRERDLEGDVVTGVQFAWQRFRGADFAGAARALGQLPENEVFVAPPAKSGMARFRLGFYILFALVIVALVPLHFLKDSALSGLKPVNVSETQVRAFLNDTTPNPNPKAFKFNSPAAALFDCLVLPPTNLFSPEALRAMRDEVAENGGFELMKKQTGRAQWVFHAPLARRAVAGGWITWSDLEIQSADSAASLRTSRSPMFSPDTWDHFLTCCQAWSWVKSERFNVMRIQSDGLTQLRLLRAVNCLDLTDREKLIQQIASVQVLSGTPPGQPPIHDWRDVRGLFFTPCCPALQDTYFSLAALEILGGLDKIDREAGIKGILKRHQGKGYFTSPDSGGFNEYHIDGSARDTIAAFESLRILGALDRVKDLDKWQFRPQRRGVAQNQLTWQDVEAWVSQQRLAKILSARKENTQARTRSLLEP